MLSDGTGTVEFTGTVLGLSKEKTYDGVDVYTIRPDGEDEIEQEVRVTSMSRA